MIFMGFADDVLDIRWRVKIWLPFVASLPILIVYYVTYGRTEIVLPIPVRAIFKIQLLDLGNFFVIISKRRVLLLFHGSFGCLFYQCD